MVLTSQCCFGVGTTKVGSLGTLEPELRPSASSAPDTADLALVPELTKQEGRAAVRGGRDLNTRNSYSHRVTAAWVAKGHR